MNHYEIKKNNVNFKLNFNGLVILIDNFITKNLNDLNV
jgi:hypothetical protein